MTFFLLPKLFSSININDISFSFIDKDDEQLTISKSLKFYLNDMKKNIDDIIIDWDNYKKFTNPYEYIHSIISAKLKFSISKIKPLSRSFYKMIEIYYTFSLNEISQNSLTCFHLAEGPGGFIEALIYLRKNSNDIFYGMTLISDDTNIPSWKKSKNFLQKHPNIFIENGADNTGNLMNKQNLIYCLNKYQKTIDIITGDGGFDFSINFNKQEEHSTNLVFAQICYALAMQKFNGIFILKVFDLFTYASLDLIYLLSLCYEKVYILKPNTSRLANSEKYIICKNFKLEDSYDLVMKLSSYFDLLNDNQIIQRFFNFSIPYLYRNKLEELNSIFGQQQMENINITFNIIESKSSEKLEQYQKNNINKCISWCQKYFIPCNKHLITSSIISE